MAPRSGNKKRRSRPPSGAANGGYYYNSSGAGAPPAAFLDDDADDIKIMGVALPGPANTILRALGGVPAQLASLTPMKIILYGSLAVVLLVPLVDSTIRQSMSLLRGDASKVRGRIPICDMFTIEDGFQSHTPRSREFAETEQGVEDNNGIIGDALPHVTNDGKFHGRYPNSLLTLFYPFTLFRDVVLDQPVEPNDVPVSYYA